MEEEGEQEEEEEEVGGEQEEVVVPTCFLQCKRVLMLDEEEETLVWPRPPPAGRKPPSHWQGRLHPLPASQWVIRWKQRGEAEGLVGDCVVTDLMGKHGDGRDRGRGRNQEGGSSLQIHQTSGRARRRQLASAETLRT